MGRDRAVVLAGNLQFVTSSKHSCAVSQSHEHFEDINQLESASRYHCCLRMELWM